MSFGLLHFRLQGEDLRYFLVGFDLSGYFLIIYYNSERGIFLLDTLVKLSETAPTKHSLSKIGYFAAGIKLSNCVDMEVEVSLRLIVVDCLFCNTFPKRSERVLAVSPTTCPLKIFPTVFCITLLSLSP